MDGQQRSCWGPVLGRRRDLYVRSILPALSSNFKSSSRGRFVCAHLAAHSHLLENRIRDYHHIVRTLLFPPHPSFSSKPTTIYSTSHLFFFGDLNFRVSVPPSSPLLNILQSPHASEHLSASDILEKLKEHDQLIIERRKDTVFVGLTEGDFWKFKCSYKYHLGECDTYRFVSMTLLLDHIIHLFFSLNRTPSWTDRILYATYADSPDRFNESNITNLLYTSIPSYTTSDHVRVVSSLTRTYRLYLPQKPIVSVLLLPAPSPTASTSPPLLRLPETYTPTPAPYATLTRAIGRVADRLVGYVWWFLHLLGAGNAVVGIFNFFVGIGALSWWKKENGRLSV